jgi:hypothetical protein
VSELEQMVLTHLSVLVSIKAQILPSEILSSFMTFQLQLTIRTIKISQRHQINLYLVCNYLVFHDILVVIKYNLFTIDQNTFFRKSLTRSVYCQIEKSEGGSVTPAALHRWL